MEHMTPKVMSFQSDDMGLVLYLELGQVDPQVVGVEEFVLGNVFEGGLVLIRAHGRLAQHQAAIRQAARQVASLLVCSCPLRNLGPNLSYLSEPMLGHIKLARIAVHLQTGSRDICNIRNC